MAPYALSMKDAVTLTQAVPGLDAYFEEPPSADMLALLATLVPSAGGAGR